MNLYQNDRFLGSSPGGTGNRNLFRQNTLENFCSVARGAASNETRGPTGQRQGSCHSTFPLLSVGRLVPCTQITVTTSPARFTPTLHTGMEASDSQLHMAVAFLGTVFPTSVRAGTVTFEFTAPAGYQAPLLDFWIANWENTTITIVAIEVLDALGSPSATVNNVRAQRTMITDLADVFGAASLQGAKISLVFTVTNCQRGNVLDCTLKYSPCRSAGSRGGFGASNSCFGRAQPGSLGYGCLEAEMAARVKVAAVVNNSPSPA